VHIMEPSHLAASVTSKREKGAGHDNTANGYELTFLFST
jgi:hypothetical protein